MNCILLFPFVYYSLLFRSPVFRAMLSGDMLEARKGEVSITDVEVSPLSREHSLEHCLGPVEQESQVVIGLLNFARRKQNFG